MSNTSNVITIQKQATAIQTNFTPSNFDELMRFASIAEKTDMVPKEYQGNLEKIFICVQMGAELGLAPMQSLHNIAVINGKPSLYGDAMLAICKASPLCEWVHEELQGNKKEEWVAICTVKRKGNKEVVSKFSWQDAVNAKLIERAMKPNSKGWVNENAPWLTHPKRMLQFKARNFALRDAFPDLLNGLISQDEALDYPTQTILPPPVQLQSKPVAERAVIQEMPSIETEKTELIKRYDWLAGQLTDIESREYLEKLTSQTKIINLRAELAEKEPELAGVITDLIEQALVSFEDQGELENAV